MAPMFHAVLICSEDECTEVFEAYGSLEELEALACDCGCALQVLGISDAGETTGGPTADRFDLIPVA
jgi:hypothetical protein